MPREGKYAPSTLLRPATSEALCRANSSSDSVARPAGFQNAASPRPAAPVGGRPLPPSPAPPRKNPEKAPAGGGGKNPPPAAGGSGGDHAQTPAHSPHPFPPLR